MTTGTATGGPDPIQSAVEGMAEMIGHIPELVQSRHIQEKVHGGGAVGRFNAALAVKITGAVGTMWCAYLFTLIALVGLPSAIEQMKTQGPLPLVQWIAQTFLQLVLLSVIIVGQNVIQAANDKRAEADHRTLTNLHKMNVQQLQILEKQEVILGLLKSAVVK